MLRVEDIHAYYGDSHVLQGVSLVVNQGEIVCLLGRNGAGKSTTLRSIMGYNPPREGRVFLAQDEVTSLPVYSHVRLGIGYVPEDRQIFPEPDGGRKPRGRRPATAAGSNTMDARADLRKIPGPQKTAPPQGRRPQRR